MLPGLHRVAGTAESCRVLRGGSFNNDQRNARCAYRNRNNPNNRNDNNGFRVVVAAHFSLRTHVCFQRTRPPEMSPGYWLGDRGFERKRGLSLAEPWVSSAGYVSRRDQGRANMARVAY